MKAAKWRSKGPRIEGAKEEKRMLLLKTAARMFNEDGYDRTSLTNIANRLGITKPSLYYYVKNKEEILFLISKVILDELKGTLDSIGSEYATGREKLRAFITEYIRLIRTDFGKCLVTPNDMPLSEDSRNVLQKSKKYLDQAARAMIMEGIKDGSLVTSSPKFSTFSIFGAINWMCFWYREDGGTSIEEITENILDLFMKGLEPRQ